MLQISKFRLTSTNYTVQCQKGTGRSTSTAKLPICKSERLRTTVLDLFPGRVYTEGCLVVMMLLLGMERWL